MPADLGGWPVGGDGGTPLSRQELDSLTAAPRARVRFMIGDDHRKPAGGDLPPGPRRDKLPCAMKPEAIFAPVGVLAIWTLFILYLVGHRRVQAARAGRVPRNAFRMGESPDVPPDVAIVNRNFMNLLESPVLFYVACVVFYVTHHAGVGPLALAWSFVVLRLVHSFIHLTRNRVIPRLLVFGGSNLVLLVMWIWILVRAL
jgi:hypothetical protein